MAHGPDVLLAHVPPQRAALSVYVYLHLLVSVSPSPPSRGIDPPVHVRLLLALDAPTLVQRMHGTGAPSSSALHWYDPSRPLESAAVVPALLHRRTRRRRLKRAAPPAEGGVPAC